MNWPPNYTDVFFERAKRLQAIQGDPTLELGAFEYYRHRPSEFINHWCVTYDPRNADKNVPAHLPFILFPKQVEALEFIDACVANEADGLVEKSRDMGCTWLCCAWSVHAWIYKDGTAIGWGSRKEMLVDRVGDPDGIFEKMRIILRNLPNFFIPEGFSWSSHASHMKFINPATGATITGEAGDSIGRGGRKQIYFKDEAAHYERPKLIEAALADNTNVQIDISSVNGTDNVFYQRRMAGEIWTPGCTVDRNKTQVLIMDWRDHPAKDQEWYDRRRAKAESDGIMPEFFQEVDRDYASSVDGIIIPQKWIKAAIDAHIKLGIKPTSIVLSALDVADDGDDKNAIAIRKGVILTHSEAWATPEAGDGSDIAARAIPICLENGAQEMSYDSIGVGAAVKTATNTMRADKQIPKSFRITPWNAAVQCQNPDKRVDPEDRLTPLNKDFYHNLKAQAWWELKGRFYRTYQAITHGKEYDLDTLISIDSSIENLNELTNELSQAIKMPGKPKIVVDKKPKGTKSPNRADAVVMAFWPIEKATRGIGFI